MSRFMQAISEGDGISVIPALDGNIAELAAVAEAAGAEAIAVATVADAERARAAVGLPVLVREHVGNRDSLDGIHAAGADAFVLAFADLAGAGELLEDLHADAAELDVDCALGVRDEEELERGLERVDPDIVLIARGNSRDDDEELERALDLLPDVPAGKLVVAESGLIGREQVVALERAGVDGVIVEGLSAGPDFAQAIEELAGRNSPGR
jgi:indole-3-glycerol phosphate synthase